MWGFCWGWQATLSQRGSKHETVEMTSTPTNLYCSIYESVVGTTDVFLARQRRRGRGGVVPVQRGTPVLTIILQVNPSANGVNSADWIMLIVYSKLLLHRQGGLKKSTEPQRKLGTLLNKRAFIILLNNSHFHSFWF